MPDKVFVGNSLQEMDTGQASLPISKVILNVDSEVCYIAGDDIGKTIEADCPWATQEMADNILSKMKGFVYKPFYGTNAFIDPAAELGDGVTVGGTYSILASMGKTFDHQSVANIGAPGTDEIEDEYPYKTKQRKSTDRVLAKTRSLISKTAEEVKISVEELEGEYTSLSVTLDGVTITDPDGTTKIRGSSIDVSTLNVQQINFSGAISFADLTGTDDLLKDVDTALGYADDALSAADSANADIAALADGEYYDGTFIDGDRMIAPRIYAGRFYATGEGRNSEAAYYIYDSYNQRTDTLGNMVGFLSYDTAGVGSEEEASKRVLLTTLNGTALKLQSDGNMSIAANRIYMMSDTQFSGVVILERACCGSSLPDESDAINGQLFFLFE